MKQKTKNKSILITGGLGFLGSYCIQKWKPEASKITIIDNLSSNTINENDPICDSTTVIIKDILDYDWETSERFDLIIHLASPVGPAGILKSSGKMAGYILDDIYWAIKGALKFDCPLVFVSTSEIYGYRDSPVELVEDDDKVLVGDFKVRNEYSIAKLLAEIVLSNTAKVSNLKYQIIRPFNISGARQLPDGGFVLPRFVNQALSGKPLTVFGSGEQVRAFTHVEDIVHGIYLVAEASKDDYNQIWNIGNNLNKTTINDLASRVVRITNIGATIDHVDPKTIYGPLYEEAWDKIPNSSKIFKKLGWVPKWGVEEIVSDVVRYYLQRDDKRGMV